MNERIFEKFFLSADTSSSLISIRLPFKRDGRYAPSQAGTQHGNDGVQGTT